MNYWIAQNLFRSAPTEGSPTTPQSADTTPATSEPAALLGDDTVSAAAGEETTAPKTLLGEDSTQTGEDTANTGEDTVAPEALTAEDITIPEGFEIPEEEFTAVLGLMNDSALSAKDRLQKLVDLQASATRAQEESSQAAWDQTQAQWQEQAKALPEIGGAKLEETLANIRTAVTNAGISPDFFKALQTTGAGNHPEVIKAMHQLTKHLNESPPVSGTPPQGKLDAGSVLFPSMNKSE